MARETRIGIALMMLLVGVFGVVVYKKWNGRQPVASIAAAAEEAPATPGPVGGSATAAPENPFGNDAPLVAADTTALEADPFASTDSGTLPVASAPPAASPWQSAATVPQTAPSQAEEPTFAAEPFVGNEQPPTTDSATSVSTQVMPVAQSEPVPVPVPTSPTSRSEPASPDAAMSAQLSASEPFAESGDPPASLPVAASTPVTSVSDDPFADAEVETAPVAANAETASSGAGAEPVDRKEIAASSNDPFAETSEQAKSSTVPAMEDIATPETGSDPFSDDSIAASAAENEIAPVAPAAAAPPGDDPFDTATVGEGTSSEPRMFAESRIPETAAMPPAGETDPAAPASRELATAAIESPEAAFEITATPATQSEYSVVTENDSYWAISKRAYGTPAYFHALAKYNATRTPDPNKLKPGMKVLTPPAEELVARFPSLVSQAGSTDGSGEQPGGGLVFDGQGRSAYRVGVSDTLSGIAQSHLGRASRWVQIYEMNRDIVPDAKNLKPGTLLRLPGDASRVRLIPEG